MPREETEEERRARKERERQQRPPETEEERRIRKEKERERERQRPPETEEERRARKERERQQRPPETEEERRIRKEKERLEREQRPPETDEERRARKERERQQRPPETEEERRIRKEKERLEREQRPPETEEERRIRKEKERQQRPPETEEERRIRKEKERVEREEKARREVVHKPLPEARGAAPKSPMVGSGAATSDPKPEPVVQARPQARAAPAAQEAAAEGGGGGDGYDDDFEEEFTADEMAAAAAAIARENAAAKAALAKQQQQQQQQTAGGGSAAGGGAGSAAAGGMRGLVDESLPKGESRAGLDANSLERQKARVQFEKDVARATALRRLVDLDDVSGTIVDLAPMSQYDLYITNFGGAALAQVAVQAPPDRGVDIEIQAERVHAKSKGVQAPEDLGLFPERFARGVVKSQAAHADPNATASKSDEQQQQQQQQRQKRPGVVSVDTTALSAFLFRVFPTIRTLLDENEATRNPLSIQRKRSMVQQGFSSSAVPLEYEAAHGRRVVDVSFSRLAPQYLLVVYGPAAGGSGAAPLAEFPGLALLWNTNDPSMPDKVLIAHGELTAGALSPTRGHLVFCGTRHGGVAVWDTREPDHYHGAASRGGYSPRLPSYTSDWVVAENHKAPIVRLSIAGYNSILGQRRDEAEQLVSLDEAGVVHFWMVTEGDGKSTIANPVISENDHGLHVFSSVRVFKASDLDAFKGAVAARGAAGGVATDLEFSPTDPSHLVIGTSTRALHVSRFGSITAPSSYGPEGAAGAALPVTSVHFSPTDSRVLLAGYDDGCVRVYLKDQSRPQVTASLSVDPITRVRCSTHLKWTGFALDQRGIFYVLDFATARKTLPVVTAEISRAADGTCTTFDVSLADKAEVRIAVGFSKGLVEVHSLNDKIFAPPAQRQEGWA